MFKKIAIGLIAFILICTGVANYIWVNVDYYIKAAVEKYGSEALHTSVKLEKAKISITTGEGGLMGLSVANPKGFEKPKAFFMGLLSVKLDTASISGNGPIVIKEIVIAKPQVTYELNMQGQNNLQTIQHNVMAAANTSTKDSGTAGNKASSSKSGGRKVIINDLYIRDGQIGINQDLVPDKALSAPLPLIHLTNIGKQQGGATPEQVAEEVLASITNTAVKIASDEIKINLGSEMKDKIDGKAGGKLGNELGGALKGLR